MDELEDVFVTDYIPTIYTKPLTIEYVQDGKSKSVDIFAERNGLLVIVYNSSRDVLVLVKQFRASVYFMQVPEEDRHGDKIDTTKYPADLGFTLEFCGGLEDKNISTVDTAREEIEEECGYRVTAEQLEYVGMIRNLTETTGANMSVFYCEVTDEMRVSKGGGVEAEGENIEVVELPVEEVIQYAQDKDYVQSPVNFMYALYWFLCNKYKKEKT